MRVLCVNPGSSSLKLSVIADGETETERDVQPDAASGVIEQHMSAHAPVEVVAVRVVDGGPGLRHHVTVDGRVLQALRNTAALAPLHNPRAIALLTWCHENLRGTPVVACFDTVFHATLPPEASTYALPRAWREQWGMRRLGFHGLSHAYAARRARDMIDRPQKGLRLVICHLGGGASLAAVLGGESVDTTMGHTPMEGLVMATRSGSVDPGILLSALRHGMTTDEVERHLERESGLRGLAGGTGDMRDVLEDARRGGGDAALAIGVYVHRLRASIGAMVCALGGLDGLVFTGGVGEHSAAIRRMTCERLGHLGILIDEAWNGGAGGDADITADSGIVTVLVIRAREDIEMARIASSLTAPTR